MAALLAALVVTACSGGAADAPDGASAAPTPPSSTPPAATPSPAPTPDPDPEPAYTPPEDWQEQALAAADTVRAGVVAIGWRPPTDVIRRLESGWLFAPDVVVTSPDVACEARQGSGLRVRTIDGQFRDAAVEEILGTCDPWEPGIALLRLSSPIDAPTLRLRDSEPLQVGEPLLAIGHSNWSAAVGGWLVLAGPVVTTDPQQVWADIGAPVNYRRDNEYFGGGSGGAPLIDLDGAIVTTLCCERDWGDRLNLRGSPRAEPLLRRRIALDEQFYVGGLSTARLATALEPYATAD